MAEIRALERADLPAVASLLHTYLPGWPRGEGFVRYLAAALLDHPWATDDMPSLVATQGGEVIGFIGSQVHRFRFDDRVLRGVCTSNIVVAADHRGSAAGALLLRRALSAGQELSWSDQASTEVMRMWRAFGGRMDHVRAYDWMLVLRPARWLGRVAATAIRQRSVGRETIPVGGIPIHVAGESFVRRAYRGSYPERSPEVTGEEASVARIVEHLPTLTREARFRADYDQEYLDHHFRQVESLMGLLVRRLVLRRGDPIGWYAYLLRPRGTSRVLHIATTKADAEAVVGELVDHARSQGTAVLTGRIEPHLHWALRRRLAVLGFARQPTIHAQDPELDAVLSTSSSLLTQLDGEWYVRP